jgi:hypothetical protein
MKCVDMRIWGLIEIPQESSGPNDPVWSCRQSWETDEDGTTSVAMGSGLSMHSSVWKE